MPTEIGEYTMKMKIPPETMKLDNDDWVQKAGQIIYRSFARELPQEMLDKGIEVIVTVKDIGEDNAICYSEKK